MMRILGDPGPSGGTIPGVLEEMQSVWDPGGANKRGQAELMRILGDPGVGGAVAYPSLPGPVPTA
jgi:hypothetical protein